MLGGQVGSGAICSVVLRRVTPRCWSKGCTMNEVAQSALPLASSDLSLLTLFLQAHWIVKGVMVGLLVCSVWVWAVAVDKIILFTRTSRAMDKFDQAFGSGQSLEDPCRRISSRTSPSR